MHEIHLGPCQEYQQIKLFVLALDTQLRKQHRERQKDLYMSFFVQ